MPENHEKLLADLQAIQSLSQERNVALGKVADLLRGYGGYRWVGLYDVDHAAGIVKNVVWSGSGAPEFPIFPITKGLTNLAIQTRRVVNVGDVTSNPHYLTAFGSTTPRSLFRFLIDPATEWWAPSTLKARNGMRLAPRSKSR